MKLTYHLKAKSQLPELAQALIPMLAEAKIMAFYGEMGAGKTTLIKEICRQLNIMDEVSSPSFSIVNEYAGDQDFVVYHFDFYRMNQIREVFDIGYENYFYSGYPCLLEWPEKIEELLPEKYVKVSITLAGTKEERNVEAEVIHANP